MELYVTSDVLRSILWELYEYKQDKYKAFLIGRQEGDQAYVTGVFIPPQTTMKRWKRLTLDDCIENFEAWRTTQVRGEDVVGMVLYQDKQILMGIPKKRSS